jgi:hypothetical protein
VRIAASSAVAEMTERAWWILGSLLLAVDQLAHLTGHRDRAQGRLWQELREELPPVDQDRPLAQEITRASASGPDPLPAARRHRLPLAATDPDITTTRHSAAV